MVCQCTSRPLPHQDSVYLCLRVESAPAAKDLGRKAERGEEEELVQVSGPALGEPYLRLALQGPVGGRLETPCCENDF